MKQIYKINEVEKLIKKWQKSGEKIVLVGGCFDLLHLGHIDFLKKAKKSGDKLLILLESDENIKITKGINRPINRQFNRAKVLKALKSVDGIVRLPEMKTDKDYEEIIKKISPKIIAITEGDDQIKNKMEQAKIIGAKVLVVNRKINNESSTKLINILNKLNL